MVRDPLHRAVETAEEPGAAARCIPAAPMLFQFQQARTPANLPGATW